MLRQGALDVDDFPKQIKSQGKRLNRVVIGALPGGKRGKPLVSEYGSQVTVINSIQLDDGLQSFLKILPKGASIQSRPLTTWGEVRDAIATRVT